MYDREYAPWEDDRRRYFAQAEGFILLDEDHELVEVDLHIEGNAYGEVSHVEIVIEDEDFKRLSLADQIEIQLIKEKHMLAKGPVSQDIREYYRNNLELREEVEEWDDRN